MVNKSFFFCQFHLWLPAFGLFINYNHFFVSSCIRYALNLFVYLIHFHFYLHRPIRFPISFTLKTLGKTLGTNHYLKSHDLIHVSIAMCICLFLVISKFCFRVLCSLYLIIYFCFYPYFVF